MNLESEKLRAALRAWAPEVYDTAARGGRVWFSLWGGDKQLSKKRFESDVWIEDYPGRVEILFGTHPSWGVDKKISNARSLRAGFSVGHIDNDPVHFTDINSGFCAWRKGDTVTVHPKLSVGKV